MAPGTPASRAMPSLGPSANSASPLPGQRRGPAGSVSSAPRPAAAPGVSTRPIPASGPKACASGQDLARGARGLGRNGGHDVRGQELGQPLAQVRRHAGVPGQERPQPDREQRPDLARGQPGRAARGPAQQQVALVAGLLGLGQRGRR